MMASYQKFMFFAWVVTLLDRSLAFQNPCCNDRDSFYSLAANLMNRRDCFGAAVAITLIPTTVKADDVISTTKMKNFVDPIGYFSITLPQKYFTLRRTAKGDLPDPKTGLGRRGSSIFTAGDMGKAELVAVERYPTKVLLEENGIDSSGDLSTFPKIGQPGPVANLINFRREKDKPGQSNTKITSAAYSEDGKTLSFSLKSEIEVQKPELLMEAYGVSQLFRLTSAKASLNANDGNLMIVFASALETDFQGPDGVSLQQAVDSFVAIDQSSINANRVK